MVAKCEYVAVAEVVVAMDYLWAKARRLDCSMTDYDQNSKQ
jgi:hypothetical protein